MRFKEDDFYSNGWGINATPQTSMAELAQALMNAETSEKLSDHVIRLYDMVGEHLWAESKVENQQMPIQAPEDSVLDKLIEISYRVHLEKGREKRIGHHKANWIQQSAQEDDQDFERYLSSLGV